MIGTKKKISFFVLMNCCLLAQAHEFWLQPLKFFYVPGESLTVNFRVGENFMGDPWDLKKERLERLELHQLNAMEDIKVKAAEGKQNHLQLPLNNEGTHLVVMQSDHAFMELDAGKFNAYLKEDGLDDIYVHREKTGALNKNGRELYARYSKLLIQVGKHTDDTWKKKAGLPIEIMPEQNPYQLKVGSRVSFKILFKGKPLFGAKVRVWNRHNNRTMVQPIFSQQDGVIETHISNPGAWMVSVVKMVPSNDPKADWESYWGSLTFGIQ